jgi:hypothetical protein
VLKPDVVVGNVYHAPHRSAQLLRGEFNDPNQMSDSPHPGVGIDDVGHALHLKTEQVGLALHLKTDQALSCINYYQLNDECPEISF